jgi:hypothetical protein
MPPTRAQASQCAKVDLWLQQRRDLIEVLSA